MGASAPAIFHGVAHPVARAADDDRPSVGTGVIEVNQSEFWPVLNHALDPAPIGRVDAESDGVGGADGPAKPATCGPRASGVRTSASAHRAETRHSARRPIRRRARLVWELAERVGFEPTVGLHLLRFSRPTRSTTPPPLRGEPTFLRGQDAVLQPRLDPRRSTQNPEPSAQRQLVQILPKKGRGRNRTGIHGFAVRCITTLPRGPALACPPYPAAAALGQAAWPRLAAPWVGPIMRA